jgi:hypothetical protein
MRVNASRTMKVFFNLRSAQPAHGRECQFVAGNELRNAAERAQRNLGDELNSLLCVAQRRERDSARGSKAIEQRSVWGACKSSDCVDSKDSGRVSTPDTN